MGPAAGRIGTPLLRPRAQLGLGLGPASGQTSLPLPEVEHFDDRPHQTESLQAHISHGEPIRRVSVSAGHCPSVNVHRDGACRHHYLLD